MYIYICLYIYVCTYVYSTGNSIQYSVMTYTGEESKTKWIYVCVKLIHFAMHLKLTQHCKSIILQ